MCPHVASPGGGPILCQDSFHLPPLCAGLISDRFLPQARLSRLFSDGFFLSSFVIPRPAPAALRCLIPASLPFPHLSVHPPGLFCLSDQPSSPAQHRARRRPCSGRSSRAQRRRLLPAMGRGICCSDSAVPALLCSTCRSAPAISGRLFRQDCTRHCSNPLIFQYIAHSCAPLGDPKVCLSVFVSVHCTLFCKTPGYIRGTTLC